MRYLAALFLLLFGTLRASSQQTWFIYLQTDNNQAFYLRHEDKVYSSTETGYLTLLKIPEAPVKIVVGFPKNVFPEQSFTIPAPHADGGWLIKNFGDKGWGLFNLQTLAVIMSSTPPVEKKSPDLSGLRKSDPFTILLANAVNDTAVLYTTSVMSASAPTVQSENKGSPPTPQKNEPAAKDSSTAARNEKKAVDSTSLSSSHPANGKQANKTASPPSKNNKASAKPAPGASSASSAVVPATTVAAGAKTSSVPGPKKPPAASTRKDTIIMIKGNETAASGKSGTTSERKDTIIMMKGNETPKSNAAAAVGMAAANGKKDSAGVVKTNEVVKMDTSNAKNNLKTADDTIQAPPARARINKAAEALTDSAYIAVFVDESNGKPDTIRISIPFADYMPLVKPAVPSEKKADTIPAKIKSDSVAVSTLPAATQLPAQAGLVKTDSAGITSTGDVAAGKSDTTVNPLPIAAPKKEESKKDSVPAIADSGRVIQAPVQAPLARSACADSLSNSEIDKLRIQMLLLNGDDERIAAARKLYHQKCLTVKQVKALSELFPTDEGKYKWFDATYPYVSDSPNFPSLGELIKDNYYLNRFKAMLRS